MTRKDVYKHRPLELDDLDRAILKALPPEGSKHGRYLNDGRSVKQLMKDVDPSVTSAVYFGRLNSLKFNGLVVMVKGAKAAEMIYQVTESGKAKLNGS